MSRPRCKGISCPLTSLLLVGLGFVLVVLILPPARNYLALDEGVYLPALVEFRAIHNYTPPDLAQTSLVGLIWYGWLWSALFGFSFTSISFLALFCSLLGLVGFYLLLRELDVTSNAALFGVALLGLNPLYLHLSYLYMTEVPFLTLLFYSCLCYLRGLRGKGEWWLWLGSILAAYDFLIRQYAALIVVALLLYLLLARRWRWRVAVISTLLPALVAAAFLYWQQGQPVNLGTRIQQSSSSFIFTTDWPSVFFGRMITNLPLLGLFTWPMLRLRRRLLLLPWSALAVVIVAVYILQPDTKGLPFYVTFDLPGNVLMRSGFNFPLYNNPDVLNPTIWTAVMLLGIALAVLLMAQFSDRLLDWLGPQPATWRDRISPAMFLYLIGLLIAVVTYAFSFVAYDRYVLGFLPVLLIFLLRRSQQWGRLAWGYLLIATTLLGSASLILQADYADRATAHWNAGGSLIAQGVKPTDIWAGFEWQTWYSLPTDRIPPYFISEGYPANYKLINSFPYYSRLGGFATRYVGVWSRNGSSVVPSRLQVGFTAQPLYNRANIRIDPPPLLGAKERSP